MPSNRPQKNYKYLSTQLSTEDTSAISDMTYTVLKNLGGRPCHYPNTTEGLNMFIENSQGYFEYIKGANSSLDDKEKIIPDIEGFCLYLGICRSTLKYYTDRGGQWKETIELFKNGIATIKKQLMLRGKIPSVLAIFDLVNNHHYQNTNTVSLETPKAADNRDQELAEKITAAGLVWNESKGEFEPMEPGDK